MVIMVWHGVAKKVFKTIKEGKDIRGSFKPYLLK